MRLASGILLSPALLASSTVFQEHRLLKFAARIRWADIYEAPGKLCNALQMWAPLSPMPMKPMTHPSFTRVWKSRKVRCTCFPPRMFPFSDVMINQMSPKFSGVWGKCTLYRCFCGNPTRWLTQKITCISWQACKEFMGYVCAKRFCSKFSATYSKQVSFCFFLQTSNILAPWLDSGGQEDLKTLLQPGLWAGIMNSFPPANGNKLHQFWARSLLLIYPTFSVKCQSPYLQCCQNSVSGSWW